NFSTRNMRRLLAATLLAVTAINGTAQEHAHHTDAPNSIEAKLRKVYYGMHFPKVRENGELVTIESMAADTPVLILYFSTDCGHCVEDAKKLPALVPQYEIPFWMASAHDAELMKQFAEKFQLGAIPNLLLLHDFSKKMHNWFEF